MRRISWIWLACALVIAVAVACSEAPAPAGAGGTPGKGVYVQEAWQEAREVSGHLVHVIGEKIACGKCHEIDESSIGEVTPERCAACHAKQARIQHAAEHAKSRFGPQARADCTMCHAFTAEGTDHDAGTAHAPSDCRRCHLTAQGKTPGVVVHHTSDCVSCHKPHEHDRPTPAPCNDCHDMQPTHAAQGRTVTAACTTCHQHQHAPAAHARATCAECHATQKPIVPASALFAHGHTECVGCHRPHEFKAESAVQCRTCHDDVIILGEKIPEHESCKGCHAPHDVTASPDRACGKCHGDKHPDHPKHGTAGTCVGCHDPHPPSARGTRARRCTSCHQAAGSDHAFHGGLLCQNCHQPHQFVRAATDKAMCSTCHGREIALASTNRGHQACDRCHGGLPHRPTALSARCESCHAKQTAEVVAGHAKCGSCHEPHGGAVGPACRTCHAEQHKTAPGAHKDCASCHQPHSGTTGNIRCATCHQAAAQTAHGRMAQGCNTCHRAHGPGGVAKPPACSSCHKTAQLAGLHQAPNHRDCSRCHTGHGERTAGAARTACLTCHADRKNHFPEAPRCSSCHLFERTR